MPKPRIPFDCEFAERIFLLPDFKEACREAFKNQQRDQRDGKIDFR